MFDTKKTVKWLLVPIFVAFIGIIFFIRGTRSHLDQDQAKYYVNQIRSVKIDTITSDTLINKRIALSIANEVFSKKNGKWRTFLNKPFDIYLINGYWFVYGPNPKGMLDYGPMLIINCQTGEIRLKEGYR
jgi:cbb3-type cytochrome oxidase subunit 3